MATCYLYICYHLRTVKLRQDEWENFPWKVGTAIQEHVRIFEIIATTEISIPGEFVSTDRGNRLFYVLQKQRCFILSETLSNSIFIFDDVICDKQDAIRKYFAIRRHTDVDCFYLCQTYAKIPKHLICNNANLILFKQDRTNLKRVQRSCEYRYMSYEDVLWGSYEDFCDLYVVNVGTKVWISSDWQGQCAYRWMIQKTI